MGSSVVHQAVTETYSPTNSKTRMIMSRIVLVLSLLLGVQQGSCQFLRGNADAKRRLGTGPQPQVLLPPPAITVAGPLFAEEDTSKPIGSSDAQFSCDPSMLGTGTVQVAAGTGGCLNAQPGIAGFTPGAMNQTVASFLVYPCGIVAPHVHADSTEVMTVMKGEGIIAQLTTNSNDLQVSYVKPGDSFVFMRGAYHWWLNLGEEQLLTVGTFLNSDPPDAALMGYDRGMGVVNYLMDEMSLLNTVIGESQGTYNQLMEQTGNPLFPMLTESTCNSVRQQWQHQRSAAESPGSFQKNPSGTDLFKGSELATGTYNIDEADTPVMGMGGGLRPLSGDVLPYTEGVYGTKLSMPSFDGGLSPADSPPAPVYWPGFTGVSYGRSLVKFVVGYCGIVNLHTHVNAAEWNTVISGSGQVSYYQANTGDNPQVVVMNVKKGDTFVFPRGTVHWWVNYSPHEQLVTVGGFTAAFPDTAILGALFMKTQSFFSVINDAVLGQGFKPSSYSADLFPLLPNRYPSGCGGTTPCTKCY